MHFKEYFGYYAVEFGEKVINSILHDVIFTCYMLQLDEPFPVQFGAKYKFSAKMILYC